MVDNGDGPRAATPSALVAAWKLNAEGVDTMYHQLSAPLVSFQVRVRGRSNVVVWCSVVRCGGICERVPICPLGGRGCLSSLAAETLYHQKARFGFSGDTYSILSHL